MKPLPWPLRQMKIAEANVSKRVLETVDNYLKMKYDDIDAIKLGYNE